jgi:hypothetical protein
MDPSSYSLFSRLLPLQGTSAGLNLYPYIRLGPRGGDGSGHLTEWLSGGAGETHIF